MQPGVDDTGRPTATDDDGTFVVCPVEETPMTDGSGNPQRMILYY
jgi:hypothetical protein